MKCEGIQDMKCEHCGKETYVIFITIKHEKICPECHDEEEKTKLPKFPLKE